MKGSSDTKRAPNAGATAENGDVGGEEGIDLDLRPGGMLVQKREEVGFKSAGPMIRIKVSYGSSIHDISVPAQSTFGEMKKVLAQETGLEPQEQRLLFRGKQKDDEEYLHMVGVKDMSKVILLEDPESKERKLEALNRDHSISKACEAVASVKTEVDKLAEKVSALEMAWRGGTKVADKEFVVVTELLMRELLKLDGIKAEGEAKVQRRIQVCRIQSLVETVDNLKARNSNPFSDSSKAVSVSTQWETFDSGVGSLSAPPPMPSTNETQHWEHFD
ncbi:BAG family molecular chaperone regulator 4 [Acorus gramineus]|uniref:BAG family molecular chaperone regulator 4 n=1 Tax=Acorus gramineus TaxID=55184 RepID=A0AAV9B6H3_ACOGR|nr:BAG family molecular chaperone regulator 4 [Acorus gramineus]